MFHVISIAPSSPAGLGGGGLFGQPQQSQAGGLGGGLFGQQKAGGLFSTPGQKGLGGGLGLGTGGGLFGGQQSSQAGGLFGGQQQTGGLFSGQAGGGLGGLGGQQQQVSVRLSPSQYCQSTLCGVPVRTENAGGAGRGRLQTWLRLCIVTRLLPVRGMVSYWHFVYSNICVGPGMLCVITCLMVVCLRMTA